MRPVRSELIFGAVATPALLAVLSAFTPVDWFVGLACGWAITALLELGLRRVGEPARPADRVTLFRAVLAAGAAGMVFNPAGPVLVVTAAVALALDAVDGQVARRTGTARPLGARFDMEVDAFLILVLSIGVARQYGWWVLAIGLARYAFLGAARILPWLTGPTPPRYWRKAVAAIQGIVLTLALTGWLDRLIGRFVTGLALTLLLISFGTQIAGLYRAGAGPRTRRIVGGLTTALAVATVWAALVAPDRLDRLDLLTFLRIPIELLAVIGLGLLLPRRFRQGLAIAAGIALGLLTVVKVLDAGFYQQLDRPFDPILDWGNFRPALGVVKDSIGRDATGAALLVVLLALAAAVALITVSMARISSVAARRRTVAAGGVGGLAVVWGICLGLGLQFVPSGPFASSTTAALAADHVRDARTTLRDERRFDAALRGADPYRNRPDLLTGLRGKDVVIAFVESYGEGAAHGTSFSPGVDAVLRSEGARLASAGWGSRSGYLQSPTFGGISWLAHSTLQSGLWVANQRRYDKLMTSGRFSLSDAFGKAGWRTIGDVPSNRSYWPQGKSFYHYDKLYDEHNVGYQGPKFSYASMPDQYSLAEFQRTEMQPGHQPVMAEIDLVSSHSPWTPLPKMVPWDQVGDGSIYNGMPQQGEKPAAAWQHSATVRRLYGESIQYSVRSLTSWVTRMNDPNLVLIMLGDHQPSITVSGPGASHRVPISIVAHDPAVLQRISPWKWADGLTPRTDGPSWRMDAFRNRFLDAFGPASSTVVTSEGH
ncbi:MAG TPA: CDP-alcohol phosphatidyltransferase family protein [Mycobacteriales bacterium]|nr:CDP-alcohol phosphatidyltransferase family protein [Mycobacteriales bacterium]